MAILLLHDESLPLHTTHRPTRTRQGRGTLDRIEGRLPLIPLLIRVALSHSCLAAVVYAGLLRLARCARLESGITPDREGPRMNLARTLATTSRVLRQLSHDRRSLALLLVAPSLLVGLFAWLFTDTPMFNAVGPAILALFPFVVMFLITSVTTLRERRSGTLERLLTTPIGKFDFILGYALAFGLAAIVQAVITVLFAVYVCGLSIGGPLWQLGLVAIVNALLGTALGLLASAFARTEFQAVQFMPVLVIPQIILGGIFMPRDQMPNVLYAISHWLPLSHAIDAVDAVATGSESWDVYGPLLITLAFVVGCVLLASLTLRRRTP